MYRIDGCSSQVMTHLPDTSHNIPIHANLDSYIFYIVDRVEHLELVLGDNGIQYDPRPQHFQQLGLDLEVGAEVKLNNFDPIAHLKSHMLNKKLESKKDVKGLLPIQENKDINPKHDPVNPKPYATTPRDSTDGSAAVRNPSHLSNIYL